jgi:hypothetical protein
MSVVLLGSTSGSVTLQEPAIAGSTVIDLPATSGTMAVLPTATSVLPEASGGTGTTTGYYGFKNRIINGAMVIDQRNAGASVAVTGNVIFPVDRFDCIGQTADGVFTAQQSTTAPNGFKNSLVCTVTTADSSIGSTQFYLIRHQIEGLNCSDIGWGTANAQTVTLSFWVRSSLTGTFGGAVRNSAQDRSYPFSYTINAANTWEQKSVTITGDTSGTWLTDNGIGIRLDWSLGDGSSRLGAAGAWAGANYTGATGQVNLIGTNGATFYITGVQLEKGSTATSFDYRPIGTELQLCQRYYEKSYNIDVVAGAVSQAGGINNYVQLNTSISTGGNLMGRFAVSKRATPTVTVYSTATGASGQIRDDNSSVDRAATIDFVGQSGFRTYCTFTAQAAINLNAQFVASIEL